MSSFTKEVIIKTLFELLNEKPLAKITVKDIVERCGVNRNTFYYHFRDISDVVECALKREVDKAFEQPVEIDSVLECLEVLVNPYWGEPEGYASYLRFFAERELYQCPG